MSTAFKAKGNASSPRVISPSTIAAKVKLVQNRFPDLSDDICKDLLGSCDWQVQTVIRKLSTTTNICDIDNREYTPSASTSKQDTNSEFAEWPGLGNTSLTSRPTIWKPGISRSKSQPLGLSATTRSFPVEYQGDGFGNQSFTVSHSTGVSNTNQWESVISIIRAKTQSEKVVNDFCKEVKNKEFARILCKILAKPGDSGRRTFIILRGVPGSGKSTLAQLILLASGSGVILSTDDFFKDKNGVYTFAPEKLSTAHDRNQTNCRMALQKGVSPIIIDNTNTCLWEMTPYAKMALEYSYDIEILEPNTEWKFDSKVLALKNKHGVPRNQIKRMIERYEKNISVKDLVKSAGGNYNEYLQRSNEPKKTEALEPNTELEKMCSDLSLPCDSKLLGLLPENVNSSGHDYSTNGYHSSFKIIGKSSALDLPAAEEDLIDFSDRGGSQPAPTENFSTDSISNGETHDNDIDHPITIKPQNTINPSCNSTWSKTIQDIFPDTPEDILNDMISKCNGNLELVSEMLLDEKFSSKSCPSEERESVQRHRSLSGPVDSKNTNKPCIELSNQFLPKASAELNGKETSTSILGSGAAGGGRRRENEFCHDSDLFVPVDGEDWLDLQLPRSFVTELMVKYEGSSGIVENYSEDQLKIRIPPKMAFKLFKYLSLNIMLKSEGSKSSYENEEIDDPVINDVLEMDRLTSSPSPDLHKIMEVEARLVTKDNDNNEMLRKSIPDFMSTRLTLENLHQQFPMIPKGRIEVIYAVSGFSYDQTVRTLETLSEEQGASKFGSRTGITDFALEYNNDSETLKFKSAWSRVKTDECPNPQQVIQHLREEAAGHHLRRIEYRTKIANAQGKYDCSYYREKYNYHTLQMKLCNEEATDVIRSEYEKKNGKTNDVDLHKLYVKEALSVLQDHLKDKLEEMKTQSIRRMEVRVITGRGNNSRNGIPKIGPSVRNYLTNNHYSFHEGNGVVYVQLKLSDTIRL